MMRSLFSFLFFFFQTVIQVSNVESGGCTGPPLLPKKPFVIVWNHPTSLCEDQGIHLDFAKWGIVDNTRDRFFGEQIVLFYDLGKWPFFDAKGTAINGGIPQLSNLKDHLKKVGNDLKTSVWNKNFSGLGVIDMEYWRPLYWTNFDSKTIYQRQSQALVRQKFPNYNQSQVLQEAIKEFNKAARDFMGQTLLETTTQRPNGKWGYYLFPRCYDPTCNASTIRNNDRIWWLFENSTGLYPSIYFKTVMPPSARALKIKQTLQETFRVKAKYSAQDIPVMPYSKSQEGPYKMYQTMELSSALLQPANMGASGVVIWGSSSDARAKNECNLLKEYIQKVIGPYSQNVSNFFGNCSVQLCLGHGRCVRKDYEWIYQQHLQDSGRTECQIPEENLAQTKKPKKKPRHEQSFKPDTKLTEYFLYIKNRIKKNFTLTNSIKESSHLLFQWGKRKTSVTEVQDITLKHSRSVNSVINFSIKSDDDGTINANNVDSSFSTPSFESKGTESFEPDYDFDDYVCKCYAGYSGHRCEKTEL